MFCNKFSLWYYLVYFLFSILVFTKIQERDEDAWLSPSPSLSQLAVMFSVTCSVISPELLSHTQK
jgi:hypothetical protein